MLVQVRNMGRSEVLVEKPLLNFYLLPTHPSMSSPEVQTAPPSNEMTPAPEATIPAPDDAPVVTKKGRKRAKKTKEQKKAAKVETEKMWHAIRLQQEEARRNINKLSVDWNR